MNSTARPKAINTIAAACKLAWAILTFIFGADWKTRKIRMAECGVGENYLLIHRSQYLTTQATHNFHKRTPCRAPWKSHANWKVCCLSHPKRHPWTARPTKPLKSQCQLQRLRQPSKALWKGAFLSWVKANDEWVNGKEKSRWGLSIVSIRLIN